MDLIELVVEMVPAGFEDLDVAAVYRRGKLVALLGIPGDGHNCEEMGCDPLSPHVIAWAEIVKE